MPAQLNTHAAVKGAINTIKKGAKNLPENYRPISLITSVISKLLEHIVYSGISLFLEKNNIY